MKKLYDTIEEMTLDAIREGALYTYTEIDTIGFVRRVRGKLEAINYWNFDMVKGNKINDVYPGRVWFGNTNEDREGTIYWRSVGGSLNELFDCVENVERLKRAGVFVAPNPYELIEL